MGYAFLLLMCCYAILGIVGRIDFDEQNAQVKIYCKNVESGLWPDYKNTYERDCEGKENVSELKQPH